MRRLIVVGLLSAACAVLAPSVASADEVLWKYGSLGANGGQDGSDSYPEFRASGAAADSPSHKIQVAAHLPGGWTLYGNYVEGWGQACHSYAGNQMLGAMVRNPHSVTQSPVTAILRFRWWETAC